MTLHRRTFLQLAGAAAAAPLAGRAIAQDYPTRPITMILPLAAGNDFDAVGRMLAERMRRSLGQPVMIENVTGAEGRIATGRVARARPDGYTIELGIPSTHGFNNLVYSLPYDVVNDFVPISPVSTTPLVFLARKTLPANNFRELIAWLKANPNSASAATYSSNTRLQAAFFQKETGTQFTIVPYRGSILPDLLAGQIDLCLGGSPGNLPLVRAGSLKAYAVTSETRLAAAPDLPTFREMGLPRLSYSGWVGIFAPKGTPKDIIGKLNAAAVEALGEPAVRSRIADFGFENFPREQQTPEVLGALQKTATEKWRTIINELGIKAK
jgi:tripartite-type tricarboxylate transporter receptor subunit TctC